MPGCGCVSLPYRWESCWSTIGWNWDSNFWGTGKLCKCWSSPARNVEFTCSVPGLSATLHLKPETRLLNKEFPPKSHGYLSKMEIRTTKYHKSIMFRGENMLINKLYINKWMTWLEGFPGFVLSNPTIGKSLHVSALQRRHLFARHHESRAQSDPAPWLMGCI